MGADVFVFDNPLPPFPPDGFLVQSKAKKFNLLLLTIYVFFSSSILLAWIHGF
jgi:hypothetical protein